MAHGSNKDAQDRPALALPPGFREYAAVSVLPYGACLAGATTDEDGLRQRAFVAFSRGPDRVVAWARHLDGLEDAYQARATHCVHGNDALYVLLQADTHPAQGLSQTLLNVAMMTTDGDVQQVAPLHVRDAGARAYSASVDTSPGTFQWHAGRLQVRGSYVLMSSPRRRIAFQASLAPDLAQ